MGDHDSSRDGAAGSEPHRAQPKPATDWEQLSRSTGGDFFNGLGIILLITLAFMFIAGALVMAMLFFPYE